MVEFYTRQQEYSNSSLYLELKSPGFFDNSMAKLTTITMTTTTNKSVFLYNLEYLSLYFDKWECCYPQFSAMRCITTHPYSTCLIAYRATCYLLNVNHQGKTTLMISWLIFRVINNMIRKNKTLVWSYEQCVWKGYIILS